MHDLLDEKQAAKLLHISQSWLRNARSRGVGPNYITIGRSVRYELDELLDWLQSNRKEVEA